MTKENREKDIPIALGVTVLLVVCGMSQSLFGIGGSDSLSRIEGVLFLFLFATYLLICFKFSSKELNPGQKGKSISLSIAVLLVTGGLAGLIFGGNMFVRNATELAWDIGVSDKFIAVTLLAGGTSLPELMTSIVAAAKHKDQLALGNILGSNIFNILLVLGCSSIITPLAFTGITPVDAAVLVLSSTLLLVWSFTGKGCHIDRWEGSAMLLLFAGYYHYLFKNNYL